jgi:hypothetical protein
MGATITAWCMQAGPTWIVDFAGGSLSGSPASLSRASWRKFDPAALGLRLQSHDVFLAEHGAVFVFDGVRLVLPNRSAENVQRQRSARPLPARPRSPGE